MEKNRSITENSFDRKQIAIFSSLSVLLGLLLCGQYVYNNRFQLVSSTAARPVVSVVCKIAGCQLYSTRMPQLIETISKNTYIHPDKEDILVIESTIRNSADRPQPYPVFEVQFSDINNNTLAFRRFGPSEYLKYIPGDNLINANEVIDMVVEVADPGQESTSFKYNYL